MSAAAETAAEALRKSYQDEKQQIAMVEGSRLVLAAMLRDELPGAIEEGFKRVMTPQTAEMLANSFIDVMKKQASVKVDSWAGGVVKGLARKFWENLWVIVFAVAFAYSVGGFGSVVALGKWAITEALK